MGLKNIIKERLQTRINNKNRKRLKNTMPTLICSNCTGGFLYHWLGLQFRSPFINLYMTPDDFITALENFDQFMAMPIIEMKNCGYDYPVGKGYSGVVLHFVHYKTFDEAIEKWNQRKNRINMNNFGVMLTNWGGDNTDQLARFDRLPFEHKVVFTDKKYPAIKSSFYLKKYTFRNHKNGNIYATQNITGKRYIDQFDYVAFINSLKD